MRPMVIRATELAELLGVSAYSIKSACRDAGLPMVQVRRVVLERTLRRGGPIYLPISVAAQVAERVLGKLCDHNFRARLRARVKRQDGAFGPNVTVELANKPQAGQ